jgi:DNA-binding response OmpR family regulator
MSAEKKKILVVEDNEDTRTFLGKVLATEFRTLLADNGVLGIEMARSEQPDLILMDIMMPHLSGLDACQILKKDPITENIPVIFLSARSKVSDITSGLNLGADDYISKPFDYKELMARIEARLRAASKRVNDTVIVGDLRIDPSARQVQYKNKTIELTLTEFDILRRLASSVGSTISRKEIIDGVRHHSKKPMNDRTIDVHIRAIRKKIPELQKHISSIYGVGYRFDR